MPQRLTAKHPEEQEEGRGDEKKQEGPLAPPKGSTAGGWQGKGTLSLTTALSPKSGAVSPFNLASPMEGTSPISQLSSPGALDQEKVWELQHFQGGKSTPLASPRLPGSLSPPPVAPPRTPNVSDYYLSSRSQAERMALVTSMDGSQAHAEADAVAAATAGGAAGDGAGAGGEAGSDGGAVAAASSEAEQEPRRRCC